MGVKGSWKRPTQISREEEDLRYELAFRTKDNPERKEEILKRLEEIQEEKKNGSDKST